MTVLQCQSVLVDLREGERRRGRQGCEVLLIDHNGCRASSFFHNFEILAYILDHPGASL